MTKINKVELTPEVLDRNGKTGRPPKLVTDERYDFVVELLLQCKPRNQIVKTLTEKYNIKSKTAEGLITEGYKIIKEKYQPDRDAIIATHIAKYYDIIEKADEVDFKAQIAALQSVEKLLKLSQPETLVQHNSLNLNLKDMDINDLKKLLSNNLDTE